MSASLAAIADAAGSSCGAWAAASAQEDWFGQPSQAESWPASPDSVPGQPAGGVGGHVGVEQGHLVVAVVGKGGSGYVVKCGWAGAWPCGCAEGSGCLDKEDWGVGAAAAGCGPLVARLASWREPRVNPPCCW